MCVLTFTLAAKDFSLYEAIEQSAAEIAGKLPAGTRVAVVAFSSEHENLSNYIMDELTGALAGGRLEVADRRNLAYIFKELNFQMSGDVSDETAVSIGKFLGAPYIITGQLVKAGRSYRYRLSGINVETAIQESSIRLDVRSDRALQRMIAELRQNQTVAVTADYDEQPRAAPKTAGTFLDRGMLFGSRGDFDLAIEDFTEAIKLDPNMAAAYLQRSKALYASVSQVFDIDENFDFSYVSSVGSVYSEETKAVYSRALEDASMAIKLNPIVVSAYMNRGRIYEALGDNDKAIADYNQAIRLDPNLAVAYNNRGLAYNNKQDYDRAIADCNQALRLDPNLAVAYNTRGLAYNNKQDYDRAIADFNQALRLDPNFAFAYNGRGNVYYDKQDYDRALADYNQALRLTPDFANAYFGRGLAYYGKQDYDRAIADFNQVLRLDPNNAYAYNNRGFAYFYKQDYDRAIADYNQSLRLDPNFATTYNHRGNAYSDKQDYDRAIADYNQAVRLDPNFAVAYSSRGFAYSNKQDYDRAIADYNQALRLDPNYAIAYNLRGNAYFRKQDYDRAIADYERALRIDPNVPNVRNNLEAARRARGR
jgi:tetratricopeptide (TPR) repeat protein